MVTCAIARDENSLQFILQLTDIDLWKFELLILEEDMKMRKSFSGKEFLLKRLTSKISAKKASTWSSLTEQTLFSGTAASGL